MSQIKEWGALIYSSMERPPRNIVKWEKNKAMCKILYILWLS